MIALVKRGSRYFFASKEKDDLGRYAVLWHNSEPGSKNGGFHEPGFESREAAILWATSLVRAANELTVEMAVDIVNQWLELLPDDLNASHTLDRSAPRDVVRGIRIVVDALKNRNVACDSLICVVGEIRDALKNNAAPMDLKHSLQQIDTVTIDAALLLDLIRKFEAIPGANVDT